MPETDLSREALLSRIKQKCYPACLRHAEEAVINWEKHGGFEAVRDLLLQKLFYPSTFELKFSTEAFILSNTIDRYHLLEFLVGKGMLDRGNLEGKVIDIGCHLGATVDALAMYGGEVVGTDSGRFADESPSGIPIARLEGRWMVQHYSSRKDKPTLVSCFNVGWVGDMSCEGFAFELAKDSLVSLKPKGQVLYTFSERSMYRELASLPNPQVVELPEGLNKREKYAFTAKK